MGCHLGRLHVLIYTARSHYRPVLSSVAVDLSRIPPVKFSLGEVVT
jgi:hypothetical protein